MSIKKIEFRCEWFFVGWSCLSLGFHIGLAGPHVEIHLPFGFFRIGRYWYLSRTEEEIKEELKYRVKGDLKRPWNCPGMHFYGEN